MRTLPALSFTLALCLLPAPALAHGGQYRLPAPVDAPGPTTGGGGGSGAQAAATWGATVDWRIWWSLNWDRLVDLRARLAMAEAASPGSDQIGVAGRPMSADEKTRRLLPPLLKALKDRDQEVRATAAIALGKIAVEGSYEPLLAALGDRAQIVRNAAALALGLTGNPKAERPMLDAFRSGGSQDVTRAWLAVGLGYLGTQEAARELLGILDSLTGKEVANTNREVLICSAAGLSVCRQPALAPAIRELFQKSEGKNQQARALLLVALGKLGDRASMPLLKKNLNDRDSMVRAAAAAALGCVAQPDDQEMVAALVQTSGKDAEQLVCALALMALGRIGGLTAHQTLRAELANGARRTLLLSSTVSFAAIGLGLTKDRDDVPVLIPYLRSRFHEFRSAAATALAIMGDASAGNALAAALDGEKDPHVFADVALAAGILRAGAARDLLRETLEKERRAEFRTAAAIALGLMGEQTALPRVLELLGTVKSASQQAPLAFAATLFGDQRALEPLVKLLDRDDVQDSVRAMCCVALGNMGDSNRYPALSALSHDHPWIVWTPALGEMLTLF